MPSFQGRAITFTWGDDEHASGTDLYIGWKIYNSNPENVSVEMEDKGLGICCNYFMRN